MSGPDRAPAPSSDAADAAAEFWARLTAAKGDAATVVDVITEYVAEVVGEASVLTVTSDRGRTLRPLAVFHSDPQVRESMRAHLATGTYRVGEGIAGQVVATGTPVVLDGLTPAVAASMMHPQSAAFVAHFPIKSLLIVPLIASGEVIGTLGVVRTRSERPYSAVEVQMLEALARRAALALAEGRSQPRPLAATDYEAMFRHSIDGVLFTAPDGRILAANPAACEILQLSEASICELGRAGVVVGDDPRAQATVRLRQLAGHVRAEVPMRRGTGEVFMADLSSAIFTGSAGELRAIVIFRDISEQVAERNRLSHQPEVMYEEAVTDELTGLPNRRGFNVAVRRLLAFADRDRTAVQLLFLDMDELKAVNDRGGHQAGDAAIVAVAEAIAAEIRTTDVAGRLGGDEFAVALHNTSAEGAALLAQRVRDRLGRRSAGRPLRVSIGMAERPAGASTSLDELLARADRTMYQDKMIHRLGRR